MRITQNALIVFFSAILCAFLIWLYYFVQPRSYQATLTFMLSDSVGVPLPSDEQDNIVGLLFAQHIFLNNSNVRRFFPHDVHKKKLHENIRFTRDGDFIKLSFEAKTAENAQKGLESWFSAFSDTVIKRNQKLLSIEKKADQQYDNTAILNILQTFRSSINSSMHHEAKQVELNALYAKLTDTTLRRIHLTILNSIIKMMRKNGQSLLSLSFIANNSAVVALEAKINLLETQKAHMAAQLGWEHPQIKAMIAESKALSTQLEDKILQITNQIYSDEIVAKKFEIQLREKIRIFVKNQSQPFNQMLNELENKVKIVIDGQNKEMNIHAPLLQNAKIRMIVPIAVTPVSFIALYGKNIFVHTLASLIALLVGLFLFQRYSGTKKTQSKEELEGSKNALLPKVIENSETFMTVEKLSVFLKLRSSMVVSIIGTQAARMAAKLSLHLVGEKKTVLLVDISGQQIEKIIGLHRGLSDVLTGDAQLQDVIYRDYDTGVDILPQGLASAVRAQDFSNDIPHLLGEFKKNYDLIILEITSEPKYGSEQIAQSTDYYICSASFDKHNWIVQMISRFPKTVCRVNSY
ncbi:putative membrane protein [Bartonella bovis]|uniref:Putative membrane protein n=1 Tax=Bartonella bovis m02 TaxID=1094492 RepID=N6VIC9_9HYPH|nr:putative membrane protein [Bartonella bovis]ENN93555.1 putative membrane protein [Bartonella bovis m02]